MSRNQGSAMRRADGWWWRLPAVGAVLTLPAAGAWCAGWVLAHVSDLVGRAAATPSVALPYTAAAIIAAVTILRRGRRRPKGRR